MERWESAKMTKKKRTYEKKNEIKKKENEKEKEMDKKKRKKRKRENHRGTIYNLSEALAWSIKFLFCLKNNDMTFFLERSSLNLKKILNNL